MKAFVMKKIGEVGWVEKEVPKCGPLDAICRPLALSTCTSDVHTVYEGAVGERTNMVLGHEGVGEIMEVGELVKYFKIGDKVLIPAITPDWGSLEAQRGFAQHSGGTLGGWKFSNIKDGVFAERFHINEADANLALLPEGMDYANATMISDMIPTGFHGVELAEVTYGEDVLIVGIGPVGLMSVVGAVLKGAGRVLAVGTRPNCVALAKEYGASDIISYKEGPIGKQVMDLTKNKGVDKIIIAGGTVDTISEVIDCIMPGGIISNVNYLGSGEYIKVPRKGWGVGMGHIIITGGLMPAGRMRTERLANLIINGRLDASGMITHRFEGLESVEKALELTVEKPKDFVKSLITISYKD